MVENHILTKKCIQQKNTKFKQSVKLRNVGATPTPPTKLLTKKKQHIMKKMTFKSKRKSKR